MGFLIFSCFCLLLVSRSACDVRGIYPGHDPRELERELSEVSKVVCPKQSISQGDKS